MKITETSKQVFIDYAKDACQWTGNPLVGGNVGGTKEERGNLTQLKRAGLITTQTDEGFTWLFFTEAGERYANDLNIHLGNDATYKINAAHFNSGEANMIWKINKEGEREQMPAPIVGQIWKDDREWRIKFPKGILTFKTKRRCELWREQMIKDGLIAA
jgi:hypothetical protein